MYEVALSHSHIPAQSRRHRARNHRAAVLREAAAAAPDALGLIEIDAGGGTRRRWRYRDLLAAQRNWPRGLPRRFRARRTHRGVGAEHSRMGDPGIRRRMAGLTLVTVNPAYQVKELRYVLEQSRASGLFLVESFRGNPMAEIAQQACAGLPGLRRIVDLEDPQALLGRGTTTGEWPTVQPGDPAQIQYTSGTTGFPKGAVLSHRGLTNNARLFCSRLGVRPGDAYLNVMPMFHTAGCSMGVLGAVQHRARLVLPRQFDGAVANRVIARETRGRGHGRAHHAAGHARSLRDRAAGCFEPARHRLGRGHGAARTDPQGAGRLRLRLRDRLWPDRDLARRDPDAARRQFRRPLANRRPALAADRNRRSATWAPTRRLRSARSARSVRAAIAT